LGDDDEYEEDEKVECCESATNVDDDIGLTAAFTDVGNMYAVKRRV